MYKYLVIVDWKTVAICVISLVVTSLCYRYNFGYDLDITMFSIAVIFPLVFTIREAFKRRDAALKFLSLFKAAMGSVHYSFEQCPDLTDGEREEVNKLLQQVSTQFMTAMNSGGTNNCEAEQTMDAVIDFVKNHRDVISRSLALKIIRFVQDAAEGMENTLSLKLHGTPISLRAYCLLFVFMFPFVFIPTIIFHLPNAPAVITYGLGVVHGFILVSLYNVQLQMEDPFDQVGLDDIIMEEYGFRHRAAAAVAD